MPQSLLHVEASPLAGKGQVIVISGVHRIPCAAGKTVTKVREALGQVLNIDPGALAVVNGKEVKGSYTLKEGDELEFIRQAGRKGLGG